VDEEEEMEGEDGQWDLAEGQTRRPVCEKEYSTPNVPRTHIRTVHEAEGRRDHECEQCGKRFGQKSTLMSSHVESVHEDQGRGRPQGHLLLVLAGPQVLKLGRLQGRVDGGAAVDAHRVVPPRAGRVVRAQARPERARGVSRLTQQLGQVGSRKRARTPRGRRSGASSPSSTRPCSPQTCAARSPFPFGVVCINCVYRADRESFDPRAEPKLSTRLLQPVALPGKHTLLQMPSQHAQNQGSEMARPHRLRGPYLVEEEGVGVWTTPGFLWARLACCPRGTLGRARGGLPGRGGGVAGWPRGGAHEEAVRHLGLVDVDVDVARLAPFVARAGAADDLRLAEGEEPSTTTLRMHVAAARGDTDEVRRRLVRDGGAIVDGPDKLGERVPLHYGAARRARRDVRRGALSASWPAPTWGGHGIGSRGWPRRMLRRRQVGSVAVLRFLVREWRQTVWKHARERRGAGTGSQAGAPIVLKDSFYQGSKWQTLLENKL